jgi:hypothetical protein
MTVRKTTQHIKNFRPELAEALADAGDVQVEYEEAKTYAREVVDHSDKERICVFWRAAALGGTVRQIEDAAREAGATELRRSRVHQLLKRERDESLGSPSDGRARRDHRAAGFRGCRSQDCAETALGASGSDVTRRRRRSALTDESPCSFPVELRPAVS